MKLKLSEALHKLQFPSTEEILCKEFINTTVILTGIGMYTKRHIQDIYF